MPLPKKKNADKRPSYEIGEFRDPKIVELQERTAPTKSAFLKLLKRAVKAKAS